MLHAIVMENNHRKQQCKFQNSQTKIEWKITKSLIFFWFSFSIPDVQFVAKWYLFLMAAVNSVSGFKCLSTNWMNVRKLQNSFRPNSWNIEITYKTFKLFLFKQQEKHVMIHEEKKLSIRGGSNASKDIQTQRNKKRFKWISWIVQRISYR